MCDLIETADYVRRNGYGLPVHDDIELMGANDMSIERRERRRICDDLAEGQSVPDWYRQTCADNDDKRLFMRAIWWATATGFFFGALIASTACIWWLT